MPDISNKEKEEIRILAKCFSGILSKVTFRSGSQIYYLTFKRLYKRSARWKYCLICGLVGLPEDFRKEKHRCPSMVFHNVQVLVSTSWFKLKDFFLNSEYKEVLEEVGINQKNHMKIDSSNGSKI